MMFCFCVCYAPMQIILQHVFFVRFVIDCGACNSLFGRFSRGYLDVRVRGRLRCAVNLNFSAKPVHSVYTYIPKHRTRVMGIHITLILSINRFRTHCELCGVHIINCHLGWFVCAHANDGCENSSYGIIWLYAECWDRSHSEIPT